MSTEAPDFFAEDPSFFGTEQSPEFTTPDDILNDETSIFNRRVDRQQQNKHSPFPNIIQTPYDDSLTLHEKRKADSQKESSSKSAKGDDFSGPSSLTSASANAKKPGKKSGRKLDPNEPASKRKAQNRAAQRAFRERKERHVKDLEDRVTELETEAAATNNENEFLKLQVERLQGELRKYRGGSTSSSSAGRGEDNGNQVPSRPFTFEFPFFGENKNKNPDKVNRNTNNTSSNYSYNGVSPGVSSSHEPSPRFSVGSNDSPSATSSSPFTTITSNTTPSGSGNTSACQESGDSESPESTFCDQLSLACGRSDHPVPMAPNKKDQRQIGKPSISAGTMNNNNSTKNHNVISSNNDINNNNNTSRSNSESSNSDQKKDNVSLFSPPPLDFDFLGNYRDPLFDSAEQTDFQLPELPTTEYSVFDPLENPIINESFDNMGDMVKKEKKPEKSSEEVVPAYEKMMTCSAVWDRISTHPKFDDLDIDGLCSELRTKAKCSDTGVLITENDVDKVLATL